MCVCAWVPVCVHVCIQGMNVFIHWVCLFVCIHGVGVCKAWANRKVSRQDSNRGIDPTGFGRQSHVSIATFALQCAPATAVQSSSVSRASTATSCTACTAVRITTAPACAIPPSSSSTVDHRCNWSPTPLKG